MKKIPKTFTFLMQFFSIGVLFVGLFLIVSVRSGERPAHALPEYTGRTGEPCAACHVNPGGGGPRTLRGLLWAARGRPDAVPQMPGVLTAPGVTDGAELYEIACGGCHGYKGEGLVGIGLAGSNISEPAVRSFIVRGIPLIGMPSFEGQFDDEQLDALVKYVAGLAGGEIEPPADFLPLAPGDPGCAQGASSSCGGP